MLGEGITHGTSVVVVIRLALPAFHRHDLEIGADAEVLVEEPRQLADRHPVAHRNRILPDERLEPVDEHRPFDRDAADRIRPVADDRP